MLSKGEKLNQRREFLAKPELTPPVTVRLKFRKTGNLQYISHLDLQRTFNRVLVRSCIPVWYTKGFNPHIKLVFSTPLSVGTQSVCEYLDIRVDREISCEEIMERLNRELTEELCITEAYIPKSDFSEIAYASYEYEIFTSGATAELAKSIEAVLTTSPLNMVKRTKAGDKEIDIIPLIKSVKAWYDENAGSIKLQGVFSATSTEFLNPEMIITALKQKGMILLGSLAEEHYSITRNRVMKEDMSEFR